MKKTKRSHKFKFDDMIVGRVCWDSNEKLQAPDCMARSNDDQRIIKKEDVSVNCFDLLGVSAARAVQAGGFNCSVLHKRHESFACRIQCKFQYRVNKKV